MNTEKEKQEHSDKPLGVLVLSQTYPPDVGGVETHLEDLTEAFKLHHPDWRVWIATYKPIVTEVKSYLPQEQYGNLTIRRFWWIGGNLFRKLEKAPALMVLYIVPYFIFRLFFYIVPHIRKVDVIHVHGINMAMAGFFFAKLFHKRVVFQSHALYSFVPGSAFARVASFLLKRMDAVLTLCHASKDEFMKLGVPEAKISVYRYWIDLNRFNTVDRASSAGINEGETCFSQSTQSAQREIIFRQDLQDLQDSLSPNSNPQISPRRSEAVGNPVNPVKKSEAISNRFTAFFVGRLIGIKGEDVVIELARRFPHIHFKIAGGGPNQQSVIDAAKRLDNLEYVGLVPNNQLHAYYQAADVVLVPSQYPEGFGRVICEALACGTPVLASNIGGIPDAMDNTVGVLCELEIENFVVALKRVSEDNNYRQGLKVNARLFAERKFSDRNAEIIFKSLEKKNA